MRHLLSTVNTHEASEIVSRVCVLLGVMYGEGPIEIPLIQMPSTMVTTEPRLLTSFLFSPRLSVTINRKKNMVVSFGDGVTFVVVLHQVWKKHPVHQDFLGFYVVDSHRMSAQTHGLLGMECLNFRLFRRHGRGEKPHERLSSSPWTSTQHPVSLRVNPARLEAVLPMVMVEADSVQGLTV